MFDFGIAQVLLDKPSWKIVELHCLCRVIYDELNFGAPHWITACWCDEHKRAFRCPGDLTTFVHP